MDQLHTTDLHKQVMHNINQIYKDLGTIRIEQGGKDMVTAFNRGSKTPKKTAKIFTKSIQRQLGDISRNLRRQASQVDAAMVECKEALKEERRANRSK